MKVAIHVTERVFQKWPDEYCAELTQKLLDRGHRVFYVKDDCPEDVNKCVIEGCNVYVGTPSEYRDYAAGLGIRCIDLLGPTLKGNGVKSPIVCAGCLDKMENVADCFFADEICLSEITPNDVLEVLCR